MSENGRKVRLTTLPNQLTWSKENPNSELTVRGYQHTTISARAEPDAPLFAIGPNHGFAIPPTKFNATCGALA